ncbi:MAG: hypothetical protein IJM15_04455 [Erysipelotrichaceae bacterium]|nr:hypothetical protein [Erysipelotrichaceae bacterium]
MSFFKETKTAIIVMLAVILGSSTISAVGSINKAVSKLNDQFYKGQGDNFCIYEDIIDKTEYAFDIYQTAVKNNYSDTEVEKISSLINDIKSEKSIKKLYSLVQKLDSAVDYTVKLLNGKLDKKWADILEGARRNYNSESSTIDSDPYNSMVKEFHDEYDGFPGSLFQLFASKAEYFK